MVKKLKKYKPNTLKLNTPVYIRLGKGKPDKTYELGEYSCVDLDKKNNVIGIEIWNGNLIIETFMQKFK